ncbi:OmpA family protein [Seohaeicola saemankumensis]|uniref:OmpA family protein n=1 Tax=Seohaeicola saemankumensis TaxID=481181 RepID=A0ABW3TFM1_9RHOB
MRFSAIAIVTMTFLAAAGLSLVAAGFSVRTIEENSEYGVRLALDENALPWAEVQANGLQVVLTGTAPSEALRFKALSTAGGVVDAARVIDGMDIRDSAGIQAPRFSVEILRNEGGISLIGLVPASIDRDSIMAQLSPMADGGAVTDLLETADYPVPDNWDRALSFGITALESMPRAKISIAADRVAITAMADSAEERRKLEVNLARRVPTGVRLALDISAPRPVITPFNLRFLINDGKARFDACSADTEEAQTRILAAARAAGMEEKGICTIGLGVPSPNWARAAEQAIAALAEIGAGSVTFTDADITLLAEQGTDQALFDRVVGELESRLPDVFALTAVLPAPEVADARGQAEFTAILSEDGKVELRGRIGDDTSRTIMETFAKARFGSEAVQSAVRSDDTLTEDWTVRVLAGLEALSRLTSGQTTVLPDQLTVTGATGNDRASAQIAALLAQKLGEAADYTINVTYDEALDPVAALPTPQDCIRRINAILSTRKINFEPGSDTPDAAAAGIINDIADILKECGELKLEISGHTDSQGRAEMNQRLSEARALAVLNALRARRVLTSSITSVGYGMDQPIADNGSEEGREANRRIEFRLIGIDAAEDQQGTPAQAAADAANGNDNGADGTEKQGKRE